MPVFALSDKPIFPEPSQARKDGLLAVGGSLEPAWLLAAYQKGIFPWFSEGEPILWWSPDPRLVLFPSELKVSKSMKQVIRSGKFSITFDRAFGEVIRNCSSTDRKDQDGTWITTGIQKAYIKMHMLGIGHSVEVWQEGELVGGLYGLGIGKCFFGESMFSKVSNASKAGFIALGRFLEKAGFGIIDCQVHTSHLESLGAREISRKDFIDHLQEGLSKKGMEYSWAAEKI